MILLYLTSARNSNASPNDRSLLITAIRVAFSISVHFLNRFVKLYAANILKKEALLEASNNLRLLNFETSNQLSDKNMGIGDSTWLVLAEVENEHDTKPFFSAVRKFYLATIKKMLKKFPFGDSLLKDLGVVQPEKKHFL